MLALVLSMLAILLLAGLVAAYVAYPHRGRATPAVPWLGAALRRGVDRLPTVAEEDHDVRTGLTLTLGDGPSGGDDRDRG